MKRNFTPMTTSLDSSTLDYVKTQATCDPETILKGRDFAEVPDGGCGFITGGNEVQFCLNGAVADVIQFIGLIIRDISGGQMVIDSCSEGADFIADCPGAEYTCAGVSSLECLASIHSPVGAVITSYENSGCEA